MSELAGKTCVPCKGGTPPLKGEELPPDPPWNGRRMNLGDASLDVADGSLLDRRGEPAALRARSRAKPSPVRAIARTG